MNKLLQLWFAMLLALAPAAWAEEFDSSGVNIHYLVQGSGEPVILIHGLLANANQGAGGQRGGCPQPQNSIPSDYRRRRPAKAEVCGTAAEASSGCAGHLTCLINPAFKKEIKVFLLVNKPAR